MTTIALKDLHPNPFRNLGRLPTKASKVEILKQSIKETSFWDNIVCRKNPNGAGGYQIAYGHNRLEALQQLKIAEVNIPVRDLSDDLMVKIMARENHEEWGAYAEVDLETVRSVLEAFANGKISLPHTASGTAHFVVSSSNETKKTYTSEGLAKFLGWYVGKTQNILNLLSFKETDPIGSKVNFEGLTSTQAIRVIRSTRRVSKETEDSGLALSIAKQLSGEFRASNLTAKSKSDNTNRIISTDTIEARANQLMRKARVKRHVQKRKAKEASINLQKEDRQVAIFLDAAKAWEKALEAASEAISKFSPEAKKFAVRRLSRITKSETLLRGKLK